MDKVIPTGSQDPKGLPTNKFIFSGVEATTWKGSLFNQRAAMQYGMGAEWIERLTTRLQCCGKKERGA